MPMLFLPRRFMQTPSQWTHRAALAKTRIAIVLVLVLVMHPPLAFATVAASCSENEK